MATPKAEALNLPSSRLKTLNLQDLTQSQVNATGKTVFIPDAVAREDVIAVHNALLAVSTFGATVVPSKGEVKVVAFTDVPSPIGTVIQPPAGEVWLLDPNVVSVINGGSGVNTVNMWLTDGTTSTAPIATVAATVSADPQLLPPINPASVSLKLTNSLYLAVTGSVADESLLLLPIQYEAF